MKQEKRLDRIEACLTPKEAVMVWLKEIKRIPNIMEYIKYLRDLPEALQPITGYRPRLSLLFVKR
jgi:hypothetical protein